MSDHLQQLAVLSPHTITGLTVELVTAHADRARAHEFQRIDVHALDIGSIVGGVSAREQLGGDALGVLHPGGPSGSTVRVLAVNDAGDGAAAEVEATVAGTGLCRH